MEVELLRACGTSPKWHHGWSRFLCSCCRVLLVASSDIPQAFSSQLLHLLKFPRSHLKSFDPSAVISIDDAIYLVLLVASFPISMCGYCACLVCVQCL